MSLGISAAAWTAVGAIGSVAVGAVGAAKAGKAAGRAGEQQSDAALAGIDEQARQFDQIHALLSPYVNAGVGHASQFDAQSYLAANPDVAQDAYWSQDPEGHYNSFGKKEGRLGAMSADTTKDGSLYAQQTLLGLNGNDAQQQAISGIQNSAGFQSLLAQGENSIRQNASATGGLRGGNTQAALAQYSPQLLAQQIQQQYSNLNGITAMSQNAATGLGNMGQASANNVTGLLQQQGSAQAGATLGGANATLQGLSGLNQGLGTLAGYGGFGGFGSTSSGGILGYQPTFGASAGASSGFGSGVKF